MDENKNKKIIYLQKNIRGYLIRKQNKLKDGFTFKLLNRCLDNFINQIKFENEINNLLPKNSKKIRKTNFPSHISENIVKFFFYKKYGFFPTWNTNKGDLTTKDCSCNFLRLEVKASINLKNGPSTFGPTEKWDFIYFLDGKDIINKNIKIYEIKLKNNDKKWMNIKVNKKQTFGDQCKQGRRPRINFYKLEKQIETDCKLVYNGSILDLR